MRVLSCVTALLISGCITPGLKEPDIFIYTIESPSSLYGTNTLDPSKDDQIGIIDAIGFQCVSPNGFGKIKSHHEIIHRRLNEKAK